MAETGIHVVDDVVSRTALDSGVDSDSFDRQLANVDLILSSNQGVGEQKGVDNDLNGKGLQDAFWNALKTQYDEMMNQELLTNINQPTTSDVFVKRERKKQLLHELFGEQTNLLYDDIVDLSNNKNQRATDKEMEQIRYRFSELCEQAESLGSRFDDLQDELENRLKLIGSLMNSLIRQYDTSCSSENDDTGSTNALGLLRNWLEATELKLVNIETVELNWANVEAMRDLLEDLQWVVASENEWLTKSCNLVEILHVDITSQGAKLVRAVELTLNNCPRPPSQRRITVKKSLERRWHSFWIRSLEEQYRLEEQINQADLNLVSYADSDGGESVEPYSKRQRFNWESSLGRRSNQEQRSRTPSSVGTSEATEGEFVFAEAEADGEQTPRKQHHNSGGQSDTSSSYVTSSVRLSIPPIFNRDSSRESFEVHESRHVSLDEPPSGTPSNSDVDSVSSDIIPFSASEYEKISTELHQMMHHSRDYGFDDNDRTPRVLEDENGNRFDDLTMSTSSNVQFLTGNANTTPAMSPSLCDMLSNQNQLQLTAPKPHQMTSTPNSGVLNPKVLFKGPGDDESRMVPTCHDCNSTDSTHTSLCVQRRYRIQSSPIKRFYRVTALTNINDQDELSGAEEDMTDMPQCVPEGNRPENAAISSLFSRDLSEDSLYVYTTDISEPSISKLSDDGWSQEPLSHSNVDLLVRDPETPLAAMTLSMTVNVDVSSFAENKDLDDVLKLLEENPLDKNAMARQLTSDIDQLTSECIAGDQYDGTVWTPLRSLPPKQGGPTPTKAHTLPRLKITSHAHDGMYLDDLKTPRADELNQHNGLNSCDASGEQSESDSVGCPRNDSPTEVTTPVQNVTPQKDSMSTSMYSEPTVASAQNRTPTQLVMSQSAVFERTSSLKRRRKKRSDRPKSLTCGVGSLKQLMLKTNLMNQSMHSDAPQSLLYPYPYMGALPVTTSNVSLMSHSMHSTASSNYGSTFVTPSTPSRCLLSSLPVGFATLPKKLPISVNTDRDNSLLFLQRLNDTAKSDVPAPTVPHAHRRKLRAKRSMSDSEQLSLYSEATRSVESYASSMIRRWNLNIDLLQDDCSPVTMPHSSTAAATSCQSRAPLLYHMPPIMPPSSPCPPDPEATPIATSVQGSLFGSIEVTADDSIVPLDPACLRPSTQCFRVPTAISPRESESPIPLSARGSVIAEQSEEAFEWDDYNPPNHNENGSELDQPLECPNLVEFGADYQLYLERNSPRLSTDYSLNCSPTFPKLSGNNLPIDTDSEVEIVDEFLNHSRDQLVKVGRSALDANTGLISLADLLTACQVNIDGLTKVREHVAQLTSSDQGSTDSITVLIDQWLSLRQVLTDHVASRMVSNGLGSDPTIDAARDDHQSSLRSSGAIKPTQYEVFGEIAILARSLEDLMERGSLNDSLVTGCYNSTADVKQSISYFRELHSRLQQERNRLRNLLSALTNGHSRDLVSRDSTVDLEEQFESNCVDVKRELQNLTRCCDLSTESCEKQLKMLERLQKSWNDWENTIGVVERLISKLTEKLRQHEMVPEKSLDTRDLKTIHTEMLFCDDRLSSLRKLASDLSCQFNDVNDSCLVNVDFEQTQADYSSSLDALRGRFSSLSGWENISSSQHFDLDHSSTTSSGYGASEFVLKDDGRSGSSTEDEINRRIKNGPRRRLTTTVHTIDVQTEVDHLQKLAHCESETQTDKQIQRSVKSRSCMHQFLNLFLLIFVVFIIVYFLCRYGWYKEVTYTLGKPPVT